MLAFTIVMEDTVMHGQRDNGEWSCRLGDNVTEQQHAANMTDAQIGAILALVFAGEELPDDVTAALYATVENALKGFPVECRPIP